MKPSWFIFLGIVGSITLGLLAGVAMSVSTIHRWLNEMRTDMDKLIVIVGKIQRHQ